MKYWGGGVFCAENSMSRSGPWHANSAVPGPQLCTGENGDTNLSFGDSRYVGMGALVLLSMVFVRTFGSPFMKNCIVIIALFFIYLVSLGIQIDGANLVNSAKIDLADAITFNWVTTFPLGFAPEYLLPILLAFLVSTVESIGDITGTMDASRLDSEGPDAASRIQGGLLADGINSFIAALMTSPPNTTFSQNTGVIEMTRCASRAAGLYCAAWLILFGVIGKFAGVITSIPTCVLGGMVIFLFSNVMISGIAILSKCKFTSRERFILAISLGVGVGVAAQPNFFDPAPSSPAAFYGVDLAHKIGFWPLDNVCEEFATKTITTTPASCVWTNGTGTTFNLPLDSSDCGAVGAVYSAAVTATVSKQDDGDCFPSFGTGSNCCKKYNKGMKALRTTVLIILKTPYCIGTLLAMLLNLILPNEEESEEEKEKEKASPKTV